MTRTLAALLLALGLASPLAAQLGVSPTRFELSLEGRPSTQSVRVFNFGKRDVNIQVSVVNWDLDEHNKVRHLPPTEQSLDQWIVVNPVRFAIPAGSSQTVRFSIRPKLRPAPGEHRAMIYFQQLPAEKDETPGLDVLYRLGLGIYGYVGEITRKAELHSVTVKGRIAWFDITSQGSANVRLQGQYALWPAASYPGTAKTGLIENLGKPETVLPAGILEAGALPAGTPVLPGDRRQVPLELHQPLPAGNYVLDLNGTLGDAELNLAVPFTVTAPAEPAPAEPGKPKPAAGGAPEQP